MTNPKHYYVDLLEVETDGLTDNERAKDRLCNILDSWFGEEKVGPTRYYVDDIDDFAERVDAVCDLASEEVAATFHVEIVTEVQTYELGADLDD